MDLDLETWIRATQTACAAAAVSGAIAWCANSARLLRAAALGAGLSACAALAALAELGRRLAGVPLLQPPDLGLAAAVALLASAALLGWNARADTQRPRAVFAVAAAILAALAAELFAQGHSIVDARVPALRSAWLPVHAGAWCAALALALAASIARISARGRDVALTRFARRAVGWAFAAATLGLVSGSLWSLQAWSALWVWEPKSVLAVLTWLSLGVCVLPAGSAPPLVRARGWILAGAAVAMLVSMYALWLVPSAYGSFSLHSYLPDGRAWTYPADAGGERAAWIDPARGLEDGPDAFELERR